MSARLIKIAISSLLLAFAATLTGCGTVTESEDVAELRSNMQSLAAAYGSYTKQNRGRAPKDEKRFRAWIEKNGGAEVFEAQSVDEMFVSSRDNEPYVVVYGKPKQVIAYEAVGVEGSRYIADNLGVVQEVDEATFAEMVPNAE